jgi:hypothetical protein
VMIMILRNMFQCLKSGNDDGNFSEPGPAFIRLRYTLRFVT